MQRNGRKAVVGALSCMALLIGGCASSNPNLMDDWETAPPWTSNSAVGMPYDMPAPAATPYTQWPVQVDTPQGVVQIYQPQPESFAGNEIAGRAAVSLTRPGRLGRNSEQSGFTPTSPPIAMCGRPPSRTSMSATWSFPTARRSRSSNSGWRCKSKIPGLNITVSLDQLMTSLDATQREKVEAGQLNNTPPKILFSESPATLVTINGPPKLQPIPQSRVLRVVNTPFIVLQDSDSKRFFIKAGDSWFSSSELTGTWTAADGAGAAPVPAEITAAGLSIAGPQTQPAESDTDAAPSTSPAIVRRIIVAEEPTELIVTDGPPRFAPLVGDELRYATNTGSNLFQLSPNQFYVLLSGRWFHASALEGPWEFVQAGRLPGVFARIPPSSPKGDVLVSVGGTTEAREAKLDASVPQTAAVRRDSGKDLNVTYDGEPRFEPIEKTAMSYAVNSPFDVIRLASDYYCCHQGVWYQSSSPTGPWAVCVSVPHEIYQIPPSCPLYHDTFVRVYDYYPEVAYVGYTPGYMGSFVYGPTVVYGTGYYYPGWFGSEYFAGPCTWGFGAQYDFLDCGWGFGFGYGWGPGWFGYDHWHDHHGDHGWWGPGGYHNWNHLHHDGGDRGRAPLATGIHPGVHNLYSRPPNIARNANLREPAPRPTAHR